MKMRRSRKKVLEKVSSAKKFLSVYPKISGLTYKASEEELINLALKILGKKRGNRMLNHLFVDHRKRDALQILFKRAKYKAHKILRNHPMAYLYETGGWAEEKFKELTRE